MRTGMIARKLGMSRVFIEDGGHVPVTVLKLENCQVLAQRTDDTHGYSAVLLGAGPVKVKNLSKARRGQFAKAKIEPKDKLVEFRTSADGLVDVGAELTAHHYVPGQFVDVSGTSIGKGFAGGMKRYGFSGLRASHGVSVNHRSLGATGQCQDPGKVFKGKKMAGHMGMGRVTIQNLEVVATDADRGLVLVKGAVPGAKGNYVELRDAVKRAVPENAPFPAGVVGMEIPEAAADEAAPEADASETDAPDKEIPAEDAPSESEQAPADAAAGDAAGETPAEDSDGEAKD